MLLNQKNLYVNRLLQLNITAEAAMVTFFIPPTAVQQSLYKYILYIFFILPKEVIMCRKKHHLILVKEEDLKAFANHPEF